MSADRPSFRPDIEGIRGVAILLVVAYHAGVSWLAGGYVGVDVFFVLSGFLITGLLARELQSTGGIDLSEFYAHRARRLLPAFLVVVLATVAIALWIWAPIDQMPVASDARSVALHYSNMLFAQSGVNYHASGENPFLHTWSLAVEEQFYFIWPFLFVILGRKYGKEITTKQIIVWLTVAGAVSFVLSAVLTRVAQPWAFFGMPTRIWEFARGGVAALMLGAVTERAQKNGVWLQSIGLVAILIPALFYHEALPYPGIAAIVPVIGTVLLLVGGHNAPDSVVSRALGSQPLRWLGRVSYSWYLWHWPLVIMGGVLDYDIGVAGRIAWSLVALGLAVLTHRYVEEPFRRGEALRDEPRLVNMIALGASVAAALIALGSMSVARNHESPRVQRWIANARTEHMDHSCWGSHTEEPKGSCVFGDARSAHTVVLWGDSHAEHWLPAMDRIGRERGWRVIAMLKPGCPVADVELMHWGLKRTYDECTESRRKNLARILAMRPDAVVLSSFDHYTMRDGSKSRFAVDGTDWRVGLRRTYSRLSRAGINTIVMRDVPETGFDVPSCLSARAAGSPFRAHSCAYDLRKALHPDAIAAQDAAARGLPHLAMVSMVDRVCSAATCPVVQRGNIVYKDDDHLTVAFSRAEAPVLGLRLEAALRRLQP
jgi:peptidoglycan/LPS O-acetylase OafA/YrhL